MVTIQTLNAESGKQERHARICNSDGACVSQKRENVEKNTGEQERNPVTQYRYAFHSVYVQSVEIETGSNSHALLLFSFLFSTLSLRSCERRATPSRQNGFTLYGLQLFRKLNDFRWRNWLLFRCKTTDESANLLNKWIWEKRDDSRVMCSVNVAHLFYFYDI